MKYYIDLGVNNGILLEKIVKNFSYFDKYIGFEAVPFYYEKAKDRFKKNSKVVIFSKAVSSKDRENVKFYISYLNDDEIGDGSTLVKRKKTANINKSKFIYVSTINFSKYIVDNFKKTDEIVLKIDIEGEEYNLLNHMVKTESIMYINKIYCEWHYHKMKDYRNNKERFKRIHFDLISRLNEHGFNLKGNNQDDEMQKNILKLTEQYKL